MQCPAQRQARSVQSAEENSAGIGKPLRTSGDYPQVYTFNRRMYPKSGRSDAPRKVSSRRCKLAIKTIDGEALTGPRASPRRSHFLPPLLPDVPDLQLHQLRLGDALRPQHGNLRHRPAYHGNFIAGVKARAGLAVLVNLVRHRRAIGDLEAEVQEEVRDAREEAD